jgi:hypothetical protein
MFRNQVRWAVILVVFTTVPVRFSDSPRCRAVRYRHHNMEPARPFVPSGICYGSSKTGKLRSRHRGVLIALVWLNPQEICQDQPHLTLVGKKSLEIC